MVTVIVALAVLVPSATDVEVSVTVDPGTLADLDFPVTVPCAVTADPNVGSACTLATTADAVLTGTVTELKRTMWQIGQVRVLDGGTDGIAATPDNTVFMTQGVFIP